MTGAYKRDWSVCRFEFIIKPRCGSLVSLVLRYFLPPCFTYHQMSSSLNVATAAEIRARVAFQKSERERLRAEEDAALEREVEEELTRAEAVRVQAAEAARWREEALQQLARLQAELSVGMSTQTVADGKRKATVIDLVEDETEGDSDAVGFYFYFYFYFLFANLMKICRPRGTIRLATDVCD